MKLLLTHLAQIFAQRVLHILFREQDVNTLEVSIVWSHAIVLQTWNSLHSLLWHILLSQRDSHLLSTVVTEVNEDNYITLFDTTIDRCVMDRLDELIGYTLIVAFLHGLNHISSLLTNTVNNQVITLFYALPTLITVHRIETTNDRSNSSIVIGTNLRYLLDETLTALWVSITAVHIAMNKHLILQSVCLTNLNELKQVIKAGVYTSVRSKTHQVQFLAVFLSISVSSLHLRILHDRTILAGTVNLHQVLVHDTTGTDIEVAHL